MNGLILVLSIIVIGYIYQSINLVTKYSTSEMPVHHLYYKSAVIGFIFFSISLIITFFGLFLSSLIDYQFDKNFIQNIELLPNLYIIWAIGFGVSLLICLFFVWLKNYILLRGIDRVNNINKIYAMTLTTPLDKLLNDSAFLSESDFKNKIIMLTMHDKKIYVGTVFPDRKIFERFLYGQTEFIFCPIYSGYRNKDTLELVITTDYLQDKDIDNTKYQIILNRKNIITATKIDLDTLFDFMYKENLLSKLTQAYNKKYPLLVFMKNKNIYIGRLIDDVSAYATLNELNHLGMSLSYQCVYERDRLINEQCYDFQTLRDLYCGINFKEIESIWFRTKPEPIWIRDKRISPEMLLKLFDYRRIH